MCHCAGQEPAKANIQALRETCLQMVQQINVAVVDFINGLIDYLSYTTAGPRLHGLETSSISVGLGHEINYKSIYIYIIMYTHLHKIELSIGYDLVTTETQCSDHPQLQVSHSLFLVLGARFNLHWAALTWPKVQAIKTKDQERQLTNCNISCGN